MVSGIVIKGHTEGCVRVGMGVIYYSDDIDLSIMGSDITGPFHNLGLMNQICLMLMSYAEIALACMLQGNLIYKVIYLHVLGANAIKYIA